MGVIGESVPDLFPPERVILVIKCKVCQTGVVYCWERCIRSVKLEGADIRFNFDDPEGVLLHVVTPLLLLDCTGYKEKLMQRSSVMNP